ncbi:MAG: O-antigen ligase family protein [Rhizobiaceae bacterium]
MRKASLPFPVILYLLCVVLPVGFRVGPLAMNTLRVLLLIMVLPLLARLLAGKYGRLFVTDFLFVAHIGWMAVALLQNNPDRMVEQVGSMGIEFLGGYMFGRAYIRDRESFAALCRWMIFLVCCTLPFAIYETQTGRPIILEMIRSLPGIDTVAKVRPDPRWGLQRAQAVFAHAIHYGLFCSVAFSLSFVALNGIIGKTRRWVSSGLIALSGFLALSSGALLAFVLQIFLITWAWVFARLKWRWWLLLGLFAVAYVIIDIFSNRTPMRVFMSYATFSAHTAYWRSIIFEWGMKNVWGSPIFGIGLNDWVRPWYMYSGSMDNFWLVNTVQFGIPGFLLLAIGYIIPIFHIIRRNFESDPVLSNFRRAWVFTFLGLSFTLSTVHVWTNIYSFVFMMFGAGMWLILAKPQDGTMDDPPAAGQTGIQYTRFPHRASDPSSSASAMNFSRTTHRKADL